MKDTSVTAAAPKSKNNTLWKAWNSISGKTLMRFLVAYALSVHSQTISRLIWPLTNAIFYLVDHLAHFESSQFLRIAIDARVQWIMWLMSYHINKLAFRGTWTGERVCWVRAKVNSAIKCWSHSYRTETSTGNRSIPYAHHRSYDGNNEILGLSTYFIRSSFVGICVSLISIETRIC